LIDQRSESLSFIRTESIALNEVRQQWSDRSFAQLFGDFLQATPDQFIAMNDRPE